MNMKHRALNADLTPYTGSILDLDRRELAPKVKDFDPKKLELAVKDMEAKWKKSSKGS
jgi:hypothetical protein